MADLVIVDPLMTLHDVHASAGEVFHQPGSQWEGIVSEDEVVNFWPAIHK